MYRRYYYVEFNEYPQTSETGVTIVYDVSAPEEDRKAFALKNIQYLILIGDPGIFLMHMNIPFGSKNPW
ncbi:8356_t:CDS:2, partial [Paraglomus occultum]